MTRLVLVLLFVCSTARTTSADRIRDHLRGALAYVQARDASSLAASHRAARTASIAALERYIERGVFPRRTADPYGARRPRFIDDRGVHCAVAFLIAESGAPELARAINEEYEYAYVREIRSPALLAWADAHGFTLDELARIQPSYDSPPTPEGMKMQIEREKSDWILACSNHNDLPAAVTLRLQGDDRGRVTATSATEDPFARCFAMRASQVERGGGAFAPSPDAFSSTLTVVIPSPQQLLEKAFEERIGYSFGCNPKPGAIAKQATIEIKSGSYGLAVTVKTKPENKDVEKCIREYLQPRLRGFNRHVDWRKEVALPARVTSKTVQDALRLFASKSATDCYVPELPGQITVTAVAKRDDEKLGLSSNGGDGFRTCVAEELQRKLRAYLGVAGYFRIDADVRTSLTFKLEVPRDRDKRLEKAREEEKKRRKKIEEEIEREKYRLGT